MVAVTRHSILTICVIMTMPASFPQGRGDEGTKVASPVISRGFIYMGFAQLLLMAVIAFRSFSIHTQKPDLGNGSNFKV